MSLSTSASPLTPSQKLQQSIANPNASRAMSSTASTQPATPQAAAAQATLGAAQAQPQPEVFNAPPLALPPSPTTHEVLNGLTSAMADPSVNAGSRQKLYQIHEMLLNADRSMIQAIIDGMLV